MPAIAAANRVVAIDLPGFGASDKPLDVKYDFDFFERTLDAFLAELDIGRVGLAVHDLGGPIGVHWTLRRPERVTRLALLNTLLYPEFHPTVIEFVTTLATPDQRGKLTSPAGLEGLVRDVVAEAHVTDEVLAGVTGPYADEDAQTALALAGIGLDLEGFAEIATELPGLEIPVRIVYGEEDRALPDVADTMARVKRDLPQADVTALPGVGHFLQEEAPDEVGAALARFFA
jgi:haloalkane dehalogenase